MVTRYDLTEEVDTGVLDITPVPENHEGRFVAYEDYASEVARLNEQLAAAQRDALQLAGVLNKAEAELKRRDDAVPVAWILHARGGDQLTKDDGYVANAEGISGIGSTPLYAAAPAAALPPEDAVLPDHKFRECVNGLLEEAIAYAGTQQLRARLSSRLANFVKPRHAAGVKGVERDPVTQAVSDAVEERTAAARCDHRRAGSDNGYGYMTCCDCGAKVDPKDYL